MALYGWTFIGARREFPRIALDVNVGSLCDLVRGKIGHAKGWRALGRLLTQKRKKPPVRVAFSYIFPPLLCGGGSFGNLSETH